MSDWQVGDLAVCVDARPERETQIILIAQDCVYRVSGITTTPTGRPALLLEGIAHCGTSAIYAQTRFRKIRPDEHEACEPEFVTLLQRIKRKEVA